MLNCIIIGAGPGGLVCTKELIEQGVSDVTCLEQASTIGGTFADTYDGLLLTSSASFSMFSDFWIGDGQEHAFWTKDEAVDYWTRYARHFGVLDRVECDSKVSRLTPRDDGGWNVGLTSGKTLASRRVVMAVGNNRIPSYPGWKDSLLDVECQHSRSYKNAERYAGKRVLVVGGGESGSDVALEVSRVASKCWVSLRESAGWVVPRLSGDAASDASTHRGIWDLPRDFGPVLSQTLIDLELRQKEPVHDAVVRLNRMIKAKNGIWGTFGTKTLSLPIAIADHGCEVVDEIVAVGDRGRTLTTAGQRVLRDVDAVVFCTGFKNHVSFLPEELQECDPRGLFKHMFHPAHGDRLVWVGWARPGFGSQFPIMEMQARYLALIHTGQLALPDPTTMERITSADRVAYLEQFESNAHRVRSLVDYHRYMDDMADLIGCQPPLQEYLVKHPRLWLTMMYGPTQATQFRLRGPGKKVALAHEILGKLPVSTWNHVVKTGLRGRVLHGLTSSVPALLRSALRRLADQTRR